MAPEAAGGTGNRVTGYKYRARAGASGVTGGNRSGGTGEEQYRGHASITGKGSGTGGAQETMLGGTGTAGGRDDRSYALDTTRGNGGGYNRGHAPATSTTIPTFTTIPTSTVTREYVSEPGIKESNTNVEFYMTGPGAGSSIGTGTIPGIGTGTGSGTRMHTAGGDSSATIERRDESEVPRGENLSTNKGVDYGTRKYTIGDGATAARMAGDIGTSSHGKDVGSSSTGLRIGEDSFASRPRTDSGGLSYLKETARSLGLGAAVGGGERPDIPGENPPVTRTVGESYNKGSAPGARPIHGPSTGTRRYTIGEDTSTIRIPRSDLSTSKTGNLPSTAGEGDLSTRSREDSRRAALIASAGRRRASHTGTRDQSSTLSYIKDVVSDFHIGSGFGDSTDAGKNERSHITSGDTSGTSHRAYTTGDGYLATKTGKGKDVATTIDIGSGFGTNARTGKDEQAYASGDNPSTRIGASRTFVTSKDSTLSKTSGTPRLYNPGGDISTTKPGDIPSYIKDAGTGAGTDTTPYSKDFAPSPRPSPGTYAGAPPIMETRSDAYMPSHQDKETKSTSNLDGNGKMRMGRYTIIHPLTAAEGHTEVEKRMEQEAGRADQIGRDRDTGRHITEGYRGMSDMAADHGRREGETRTAQEYGSQPSSSVRDDASAKHDRIRLDLEQELREIEQEALEISRGKDTATSTAGSGQKYSSLVSEHQAPIERKRIREDMAHVSSRNITPPRKTQETRIPGDFDSQERYDRDIAVGEVEPPARGRAQEVRDEAADTSSQVQLEPPPRQPTVPNLEQQQQQETYEREAEKAARESSMERHRTADLARTGSGPGGMRTTMRGSPEYKEQKASGTGQATASEKGVGDERGVTESRIEGDDDYGAKKGIFERAADKMGNLLHS